MSVSKSNQRLALTGAILTAITLAVYWTLLNCGFIDFDDDRYVTANSHVRAGLTWAGVSWAFQTIVSSNWHPLTLLSHMLDCQLWGLNPTYHHLTNLLLHIANSVLLLVWLQRMTGAFWRSALVAALFAWHPLHVESVAWVAERKDVLSTFFWLLALMAYTRYVEESKVRSPKSKVAYVLALLFFVLGLLSKPMVVTLPCVLLLLDYWPFRRVAATAAKSDQPITWTKLFAEKIPFFVLAAASSVVTMIVQKKGGAVVESLQVLSIQNRIGNALVAYDLYLRKTVWPSDLGVFYPHPGAWPPLEITAAAITLLAITIFVLKFMRRWPYLVVGWCWFLGTLVPAIGLVQVGGQSMADRYSYVPLIGIFIMVAWGANDLVANRPRWKIPVVTAFSLALAGCLTMTAIQTSYWRDSETIFKQTIRVTGNTYVACGNLGAYLATQNRYDEALVYLNEAFQILPSADAEVNLGDTLVRSGQTQIGVEHLRHALQINPDHVEGHYDLGQVLAKQGQNAEAITEFREALRLRPDSAVMMVDLSKALAEQGDLKGAAEQTAAAALLAPEDAQIESQLATLLARQQKIPEAIEHYQEAVRRYRKMTRLMPDEPGVFNNFAWLLATNPHAEIRNGTEAVTMARRACKLTEQKNAQLIGTLAAALAEAGQFDEAIKTAQTARDVAKAAGETEIAARNEELIKLYQGHQAYREEY